MPSKKTSDYAEFVKKFEESAPKTTDDCYTPNAIMSVVNRYVTERWGIGGGGEFVRPFYPGGDYEHYDYPADCVVVDNPPFSILSKIKRFYCERGIKFFLFCPSLTAFSSMQYELTYIFANGRITYANGAVVNTAFVTNLPSENLVEVDLQFAQDLDKANREREHTPALPKYEYPDELITAAKIGVYATNGIEFHIRKGEALRVSRLDAQKSIKKGIFGGGLLLGKNAVERRVKADAQLIREDNHRRHFGVVPEKYVFELTERERKIQESLQ